MNEPTLNYDRDLNYDHCQFEHVRAFPAGKETNLAFSDIPRFQIERRAFKSKRWIPAFAANDTQLKAVLMLKAWRTIHGAGPLPADLDWHSLNEKVTQHALRGLQFHAGIPEKKKQENEQFIATIQRCGGYLQFQAAIAYRSWRQMLESTAVAELTHCSPAVVRVHLHRLLKCARSLGYETCAPHWRAGKRSGFAVPKEPKKPKEPRKRRKHIDVDEAVKLRQAGLTYHGIAAKLGCKQVSVWCALRRHGKLVSARIPVAEAARLNREEHLSSYQIGKRLGFTPAAIRNALKKHNLWVKHGSPRFPIEQAAALRRHGLTYKQIGARLEPKYTAQVVATHLRKAGMAGRYRNSGQHGYSGKIDVHAMKVMHDELGLSFTQIARAFGVTSSAITYVWQQEQKSRAHGPAVMNEPAAIASGEAQTLSA